MHVWGPASTQVSLQARLMRYLSPPLFPVGLRELPCRLHLHEVGDAEADIGEFRVGTSRVCHPGPTVGYPHCRTAPAKVGATYLPDHEPRARSSAHVSVDCARCAWTSGGTLAERADLLIHDSQYPVHESPGTQCRLGAPARYATCSTSARSWRPDHLVPFHHDPGHSDADIDRLMAEAISDAKP